MQNDNRREIATLWAVGVQPHHSPHGHCSKCCQSGKGSSPLARCAQHGAELSWSEPLCFMPQWPPVRVRTVPQRGLSFLILFRRLDRKEIRGANLHLTIQMQRPLGAHLSPGLLDTLCPPIRQDLSNGMVSSSRETNNSPKHDRSCPWRAESRYQAVPVT